MDSDRSFGKNIKRVSFQDCESTPIRPLRKMPSFPILATETLFSESSENSPNLSQVPFQPAIKPVFTKHDDHAGPKFSSFMNNSCTPQKLEPSTMENLHTRVESSSVISKLLKDSMITSADSSLSDISPIRESSPKSNEDEASNETKARTDCKYYFWFVCIVAMHAHAYVPCMHWVAMHHAFQVASEQCELVISV